MLNRIQLIILIRIRIQLFTSMRILIRILLLIKVMEISDRWSIDPPGLHCEAPVLYWERLRPSTALF
jgi:hypothetical protein